MKLFLIISQLNLVTCLDERTTSKLCQVLEAEGA